MDNNLHLKNGGTRPGLNNYDWDKNETVGHDCRLVTRFVGNWEDAVKKILSDIESNPDGSKAQYGAWGKDEVGDWEQNAHLKKLAATGRDWYAECKEIGIDPNDFAMWRSVNYIIEPFSTMIEKLGLENPYYDFHFQYPTDVIPLHNDSYDTSHVDNHNDLVKFFIFLEDWKPGHFMQFGTTFLKWKKGDVVYFDWKNIPHATANAGWEPRCMLQVSGVVTSQTKDILAGYHPTIKV